MGFLDRFSGKADLQQGSPSICVLRGGGNVEVVGESHYQEAFEKVCGPKCKEGYDISVLAHLVPEPDNAWDPNAVGVYVDGLKVGHLARPAAVAFLPVAEELARRNQVGAANATIRGGWDRGRGDSGSYGIHLDLAPPGECIPT